MRQMLVLVFGFMVASIGGVSGAETPARSFPMTDGRLDLPVPIAFETGGAKPTEESAAALDHVAAFLAEKSYVTTLRIEGHVAEGVPDGQALSERRAMAVARALVTRGADCKRLIAVGFGANKPVAANDSAEGRAQNTRVEVAPAALRDRAIGGMPLDGGGKVAGDVCQ